MSEAATALEGASAAEEPPTDEDAEGRKEEAMNRSALEQQLADARTRRDALTTELADLVARLLEIRAALGNPFFYSHPEHPDERKANYTGYASHDAIAPSVLALHRVEEEIRRLERELGHHANDDTPSDT